MVSTRLTVLHGDALVLDPTYVAAQFVLTFGVLNKLCLNTEAPHLLESVTLQLYLVQDFSTNFDNFVCVQLDRN